jgi:hypothetical protein
MIAVLYGKYRSSDSLFANQKPIFRQANDFSASIIFKLVPLLVF